MYLHTKDEVSSIHNLRAHAEHTHTHKVRLNISPYCYVYGNKNIVSGCFYTTLSLPVTLTSSLSHTSSSSHSSLLSPSVTRSLLLSAYISPILIIFSFLFLRPPPVEAKDTICNLIVMSVLSVCNRKCMGKESIGCAGWQQWRLAAAVQLTSQDIIISLGHADANFSGSQHLVYRLNSQNLAYLVFC